MKKKILVVVAHPDDEVLGIGGTLASHAKAGDEISCLFLADGETSRAAGDNATINARQEAAHKAAKILGIQHLFFGKFPDNKMDSVPLLDVVQEVERYIQDIKPDVIYTHHQGDLNIDHQITYRSVMTASRPIPDTFFVKQIFCFETLSSTEWGVHETFIPNTYHDIEGSFTAKIKALECYENEMRAEPHPRSYKVVEALAIKRGSESGLQKAEALDCKRLIQEG